MLGFHRRRKLISTAVILALLGCLDFTSAADKALCKTVTCMANSEKSCDRSTADCPPCIYKTTTGYTCFGKVGNVCPFPDAIITCDTPATENRTATPKATLKASSAPTPSTTPASASARSPLSATAPSSSPQPTQSSKPTPKPVATSAKPVSVGDSSKSKATTYITIAVIPGVALGFVVGCLLLIRCIKRRKQEDNGVLKPVDKDVAASSNSSNARTVPADSDRGSDIQSLMSMASVTSSTMEFGHVHPHDGRFGAGSSHNNAVYRSGASPAINSHARTHGRPKAIVEEEEMMQSNQLDRRMQMASVGGQSNQYKRKPSCRSGIMYDDYDIVDPGTLCDAERRNTETLVRDGRFRHFSTVSITDSDISIDDIKEVRCSKEHEI